MKLKGLPPRLKPLQPRITESMWSAPNATASARGYGYKWQQARAAFLKLHPLCCYCQRADRVTAATVVDHIKPHRGDAELFWNQGNWQPLCKQCHDSIKQREERAQYMAGL